MTAPKPGDRVKITVEGPVYAVDELARYVELGTETVRVPVPIRTSSDGVIEVECFVVPPPMPEWHAGDVLDVTLESGVVEEVCVMPVVGPRRPAVVTRRYRWGRRWAGRAPSGAAGGAGIRGASDYGG